MPFAWNFAGWVLLLFALAWTVQSVRSQEAPAAFDWKWWGLIGALFLCFRWPSIWRLHELYPDESQLLAGAITLRHDPVFWRSVDGNTAGPLDFYFLLPAAFASGVNSYAVTRLMAVVAIWGTLVAAGEALVRVIHRSVARAAVLPLAVFESFTTNPEFVHYSTELVPNLLMALAAGAMVQHAVRPSPRLVGWAGLLLGSVPFSKLQAVPIAALLWIFLVWLEIAAGRKRNLLRLFLFSMLPLLTISLAMTAFGQIENAIIPYLLHNFEYVGGGRQSAALNLAQLWQQAVDDGYLALWFSGSALFLCFALVFIRNPQKPMRLLAGAAGAMLGIALFCVFVPGRPYAHYLNLTMLPLTLVLGATLALALPQTPAPSVRRRMLFVGGFLLCAVLPLIILRASPRPDRFENYNNTVPSPAHRQLAEIAAAAAHQGEALGIWGWRSSLYVETGLPQATREAHTEAQLVAGPWHSYFLRRYFADLQASNPPVFVDAVGPGNFRFQDRKYAHEIFPPLHDWILAHYRLVADLDGSRIYARNDRFLAAQRVLAPNAP